MSKSDHFKQLQLCIKQKKIEKKISTHIVGPVGEVEAEVLDGVLRAGRHFRIGDN